MSHVRVTYSGLISFGVVLITVFTGIIFTLIVTRRLGPEEFGTWSLIGSLIVLVMVLDPISTYWATRQVARNEKVTISALGSNFLFSIIASGFYLILIFFISETTNANYEILLFSTILIPLLYITKEMKGILGGYKPQGSSYGLLIFEVTKIPLGFVLVYWLDQGIWGAVLTTALSQSATIIFYLFYIREKLREKFQLFQLKIWIKRSWLPLLQGNQDRLIHLDVVIFSAMIGSLTGLAFLAAAKAIVNSIAMTVYISTGLYPKLIAKHQGEYIVMMFKRTLLFTIPIMGLVLVFAKPGLWIINPNYLEAIYLVYVWVFIQFAYVVETLLTSSLLGLESVDVQKNPKLKQFLKSKLFKVPVVDSIGRIFYLIMLVVMFYFIIQSNYTDLEIIFWWGVVGIIANFMILGAFWIMLKNIITFKFPIMNVLKYVIVTFISSLVLILLIDEFLVYEKSIFEFVPIILPYLLLYCSIYISILYLWDRETRNFLKSIVNELKRKA